MMMQPQLRNEPKVTNEVGAIQSKLGVDWTYLPLAGARAVAVCMADNSDEHGGTYPKDNWRGLLLKDHINHIMEHVYGYQQAVSQGYDDEALEHLVHLGCRALMAIETQQAILDKETPLDW